MAGGNNAATVATAAGIAKRVHGDVVQLLPKKGLKALNRIKFEDKMSVGGEYVEQVWLTGEHGFTYGGSSGAKRTLNAPEVAISKLATLSPSAIDFRSEAVIDLMSRAKGKGEKAFENYVTALLRNSKQAFDKRLEISVRMGGSPLCTLSSATDANTTTVLTPTLATWAPAIWLGSRNCPLDAYSGSTLLNTTAPLYVSTVGMSMTAPTITCTGAAADIDAIVLTGTSGSGVDIYFRGQYGNDMTGLKTIGQLASGNYLGVSADEFTDVWRGNQVTWNYATTEFTWAVLQSGLELAASRGLEGDVIVSVPLPVWSKLNSSLGALRVLDSSYEVHKAEQGHGVDAISYHCITGKATIEPSGYQQFGEVLAYPDPSENGDGMVTPKRFGSTNVTFDVPGKGGEMFRIPDDTNTCEWRAFSDQAVWLPAPRGVVRWAA